MINPFTLPAVGGALFAAVAIGIHLGESAIGLIDPVHMQGPAIHPRDRGAAIDENRIRPRAPAYGELYGWEEGEAARAADCGDCEALAARDAYAYTAVVPYFGGIVETPAAPVTAEEEAWEAPPPEDRVEPETPILRYTHYRVAAEPEAAPAKPDKPAYE